MPGHELWRRGMASLVLASALIWTSGAEAGPITFNTALPVHANELILREQVIWLRATDDPSPMDRHLNVIAVPTVLVYGAHPRVALFGILPFLYKRMDVTIPSGDRVRRSASGFGDLSTFVRVTALQIDRLRETIRLAPFVGLKMPTGATGIADDLGQLPPALQLGSGSWDPFGGLIFTWQKLRWEFDLSGSYVVRTRANDFNAGDEARGDASFQYRVVPWGEVGPGVPSWLFAVLETNVIWQDHDEIAGVRNPNSGGVNWYLAPGLQWVTLRTVLEAAVQIPVLSRPNGQGLGRDFIARLSFRVNF
ncbi:MAG: transporter [Deltaproteobacteria bacterium]|nr:transporter [Deltaproteobacteria bacterium]